MSLLVSQGHSQTEDSEPDGNMIPMALLTGIDPELRKKNILFFPWRSYFDIPTFWPISTCIAIFSRFEIICRFHNDILDFDETSPTNYWDVRELPLAFVSPGVHPTAQHHIVKFTNKIWVRNSFWDCFV